MPWRMLLSGFLWDNAIAHGKSLRDYGEFVITEGHVGGLRQEGARRSSWIATVISSTRPT